MIGMLQEKTLVAARFPCQKPRIGFSLLQEAYRLAHLCCLDPQ